MSEEGSGQGGLFCSLKVLAANLIAIVHTRLELLSTEWAEERERLATALVLILAALFSMGMGFVMLTLLIVAAYWDSYRYQALAVLATLYLAGSMLAWWLALRRIRAKPKMFAASLTELSKDRQALAHRP